VYLDLAQNQLATIWMNAPDQADVTHAADLIERRLRRDPYSHSESRDDNSRIMMETPLAAAYDVSDDDRMVTAWAFWRI
jgi:hypothetical protein